MQRFARFNGEWDANSQRYVSKRLVEASTRFGIATDEAHDALGDVQMTLKVLEGMVRG